MQELIGRTLGHYRIVEKIDESGMFISPIDWARRSVETWTQCCFLT